MTKEEIEAARWKPWQEELSGLPRALKVGEVAAGFWELRTSAGRTPVMTLWDDDIEGYIGRVGADGEDVLCDMSFCERYFSKTKAIPHATYVDVVEGRGWPVDQAIKAATTPEIPRSHADQPNEVQVEKHADIHDRRATLKADRDRYLKSIGGKVTTQEHADVMADFKNKATALHAEATEGKRIAKEPALAEAKRLQDLWEPIVSAANVLKGECQNLIADFLRAEKDRKEAERKAALAAGEAAKPVKVSAGGGGGGRAATLTKTVDVAFDDVDKAWATVSMMKPFRDDTGTQAIFKRTALAFLRAGGTIEGARLVEGTR